MGGRPEAAAGRDTVMGFVGVTTGGSSIMKVFPKWADALDLPTRTLRGVDVPLDASAETYRELVTTIRDDRDHWGALVTTHKMGVFAAARDLFDDLDELAVTFEEISSIAKRGDRLTGKAKDPVTVQLALDEFLPVDHFAATGGAALVLGSGGAGCALTYQLGQRADAPSQIICTALEQSALDHHRQLHERGGVDLGRVRYVLTPGPDDVDALLAELPPASLVVNATGMGKDRPGSPLTEQGRFPARAVVWEFNYRGPLQFLQQARAQQAARDLVLEDGWRYFVHGWSQVVADVFDIPMPPATVAELSRIAAEAR
ncbi:MAG: hypothetical protein ABWX96_13195 [Propionibacteriaceae bacterium]